MKFIERHILDLLFIAVIIADLIVMYLKYFKGVEIPKNSIIVLGIITISAFPLLLNNNYRKHSRNKK